jgi:hypothetical protein
MKIFAVRLSFGSFLKLMVVGCFCGAVVMAPINAFLSAMSGEGARPGYFFLFAPIGGMLIGTILGIAGYPVYAFLTRKFPGLSTFKGTETDAPESTQIAP